MDFTPKFRLVEKFVKDNSPTILTVLAVTGLVYSSYLTGKASLKAQRILDREIQIDRTRKNDVKLVWKLYLPAAGTTALTALCIIAANRMGTKRTAAMAAAYTISERAFLEYKEKVVEKLGETKEQQIRDEVAQDRVHRNPNADREIIIAAGGDVLCFDSFTGRYFHSDMETIKKAMNDTNYQVNNSFYASLSDFYNRIGLPATSYSDEVGWNSNELMDIAYSTVLSEDGKPCISLDFAVAPIRGYHRVH